MIKKSVKIRCLGVYPRPIFFVFWFDSDFSNSFLHSKLIVCLALFRCAHWAGTGACPYISFALQIFQTSQIKAKITA
jgi:hypothetical protein